MRALLAALIVATFPVPAFADERAAEAAMAQARIAAGLQATAQDALLTDIAAQIAQDNAARRVLDHRDGQGRDLATRLGLYPYRAAAENLAMGTPDGAVVVRLWVDSPPHRANLLNASVTHHGLARIRAADGQDYWALVLAAPR
jgi:uncharacterized protein YkwD